MTPEQLVALAAHYPDLIALGVGTLAGYVLTMMMDLYFLPVPIAPAAQRLQQGFTFVLCWVTSTACSVALWSYLDPPDPLQMRLTVSLIVSVLSFAGYPWLINVALRVFPKLGGGSAWRNGPPPKDPKP